MLKIKEYVNSRLEGDYRFPDIVRIMNVCAKHDIEITFDEAEDLWDTYSDNHCAIWLFLPDDDDKLFEIIIEQAKEMWKFKN